LLLGWRLLLGRRLLARRLHRPCLAECRDSGGREPGGRRQADGKSAHRISSAGR
jgi:hypothetical protein